MNKFYPNMYQESIYSINYKKMYKKGIRLLLFDLDNTCVPYHSTDISSDLKELFKKLKKQGFNVLIFSNSPAKRLKNFSELGEYNYMSLKPLPFNFYKMLRKYNLEKEEVCIIGDQLLTDILGGNLVGINTCLIKPLSGGEFLFTRFSRKIETLIFRRLARKKLLNEGEFYD